MTAFFFNFLVKISSLLIFFFLSSFAEVSLNKKYVNKSLYYQLQEQGDVLKEDFMEKDRILRMEERKNATLIAQVNNLQEL